jgi:hypothetical protein
LRNRFHSSPYKSSSRVASLSIQQPLSFLQRRSFRMSAEGNLPGGLPSIVLKKSPTISFGQYPGIFHPLPEQ